MDDPGLFMFKSLMHDYNYTQNTVYTYVYIFQTQYPYLYPAAKHFMNSTADQEKTLTII